MAGAGSHGQNGAARGAEAAPAPRQWELAPELPLAQLDAAAPDLTRLQVQLLANRGLRGEPARQFMDAAWRAQPPQLLGMDAAVERIRRAAERGEQVVVFGDFDVDGLTSCAVMLLALLAIGIAARAYVPARDAAGRGPSEEAVRALAAEGTQLLVTTDCGTTNVAEVELAARLGIDVIVTDHHLPQGPLAPAVALVNPRQPGCPSSAANLAGVGVAFRVAEVLLAAGGSVDRIATLEALLDLVAIGTVGDMAPMTPENWALVRAGLHRLNTRPRAGLLLLLDKAGVQMGTATERDISFAVAPRLNAAGRMGDPLVALHLLTTEDHDEATRLARELEQLNATRQQATDAVVVAARAQVLAQLQVSQPVLFAAGDGWPLGIIGLVANRLTEEFDRPVIVVSRGETECRGSMRGPVGLNLVEALGQRAELLRHFGGHAQAAGFTIERGDLDTLVTHLRAAARQAQTRTAGMPAIDAPHATDAGELPAADVVRVDAREFAPGALIPVSELGAAAPTVLVDCRLPLRRVTPETYTAIRQLAPFGVGYAEPVFCATRVRIDRCWRSGPQGRNLRLLLRDGVERRTAFWGRQGAAQPTMRGFGLVDVAYTLDRFARAGTEPEYVLRVIDLRPAT